MKRLPKTNEPQALNLHAMVPLVLRVREFRSPAPE
jgi:hypothetical protein